MLDAYLASAGLRVRDHAVTEGTLTLEPEKDGAAIILSYSYGERKAGMLYPSGTRLEKEAHSSGNGSILPELRYQFGIAIPDLSAQVIPLTVMNTGFTFTYDQVGSRAVMDYPAGAQPEPVFAASAAATPTPRPKAVPTATPKPTEPTKNYSAMECQSRAMNYFNNLLWKNPASLTVHSCTYSVSDGGYGFYIDYSAMNGFGGYNRETYMIKVNWTTGRVDFAYSC